MERRSTKRIIEATEMWDSLEIHRAMVATPAVGISVVFVAVEVAVFVCDFVAVRGDELVFQCLYILLIISFFWWKTLKPCDKGEKNLWKTCWFILNTMRQGWTKTFDILVKKKNTNFYDLFSGFTWWSFHLFSYGCGSKWKTINGTTDISLV